MTSTVKDLFFFISFCFEQYVENMDKDAKVVLTGHSLGGAIAKIVAANLNVQVVAFSSPGLIYSHRALKIPISAIDT